MRPRISTETAQRLDALRGDDETMADTIERLLDGDFDLADADALSDRDGARPRIPDEIATRLRERTREDERITDTIDRLIASDLVALGERLERTPTARDVVDDDATPGVNVYQSAFGTWNAALRAAGFEPNQDHQGEGSYTDPELIEDLQAFAEELGDTPSSTQMMQEGPHSTSTYIEHFGSWSEAVRAAGLEPRGRGGAGRARIPDENLLDALRDMADTSGEPPAAAAMDQHGPYSSDTYKRRFGSWTVAIEEAGLDPMWECMHCGRAFGNISNRDTHQNACDLADSEEMAAEGG